MVPGLVTHINRPSRNLQGEELAKIGKKKGVLDTHSDRSEVKWMRHAARASESSAARMPSCFEQGWRSPLANLAGPHFTYEVGFDRKACTQETIKIYEILLPTTLKLVIDETVLVERL